VNGRITLSAPRLMAIIACTLDAGKNCNGSPIGGAVRWIVLSVALAISVRLAYRIGMRTYLVLINGIEAGSVEAASYAAAKSIARATFKRRCDVIG
jgi:hypothetical protein